jgi:magnesium transporter
MKKNIIISSLLLIVLLISSCSDVLDRPELNDMNDDTYWRNETDLRLFANGFYINYFVGYNNTWGVAYAPLRGYYFSDDFSNTNVQSNFESSAPSSRGSTSETPDMLIQYAGPNWNFAWVRKSNLFIDRIENVAKSQISSEAYNHWLGVARFFKGFEYHRLVRVFGDVMEPGTRPQIEEFDNGLFLSIKMMQFDESLNQVSIDNFSIILIDNWIITFQEEPNCLFNPVKERLIKHANRFRELGTDYLAFSLLDVVIDNYIFILGVLGEKIEDEDNKMVLNPNRETLKILNLFKRQLSDLGRYIKPAKEMISILVRMESDVIAKRNYKHFKELHDNINQAVELLDYYHGVLYDGLNLYHSSMSTRLNDIMALLTIFSVVFIPLSFIVGVYGMNFENMPELHMPNGYFIIWGVMILIAATMLLYFKWKKWF